MKFSLVRWGIIALALVIAFGSVGVSYAHFSKGGYWPKRDYKTTCPPPSCDVIFTEVISNDDGNADNVGSYEPVDPGDDGGGTAHDYWGPSSSDDPSAPPPALGQPSPRYDKDVARTTVRLNGCDEKSFILQIENAYPSYYPTVFFALKNTGDISSEIKDIVIDEQYTGESDNVANDIDALYISLDGIYVGKTINTCGIVIGSLQIHTEQIATQDTTYTIHVKINYDCTDTGEPEPEPDLNTFGLDYGNKTWDESPGVLDVMRFKNDVGTGTLTKLELMFDDSSPHGKVRLGIYADHNGLPGYLLRYAGEVPVTNGWVSIDGLNLPVTGNTYYWLAFNMENYNNVRYQTQRPLKSHYWYKTTYGVFPNEYPYWNSGYNDNQYVMRAYVAVSGP